jgi:hypothetical protein
MCVMLRGMPALTLMGSALTPERVDKRWSI